ncbi:MAG: ABC transporter permease [Bacteroidota bacterium]
MNISESILLAFNSIKVNKLRASLTLLSIAIGVFAIIGAGALVNSINSTVSGELAEMGESSFAIYRIPKIQMGRGTWRKYQKRKAITYSQYRDFRNEMTSTELISCQSIDGGHILEAGDKETNNDVTLVGTDENYFLLNNRGVTTGRGFSISDIQFDKRVALIGNDIVVKLFPNENPLGKEVKIKNQKFTVIGILEQKGAILGQSQDNMAIIPITPFLKYYASWWDESLDITVRAYSNEALPATMDEAIGVMRSLRNVKPWQENNFEIETNESLSDQFSSLTIYLSWFGYISGGIALIAAGVGIMNIMLVSVKERTREIGIRKAVGAKRRWIMYQFLIETVTLCQIGGLFGILGGAAAGALFSVMINVRLSFPIDLIILSVVICTILGVASGLYPAWKAARLDPIEALRYE